MENSFDIKVNTGTRITTFLNVTLDYLNNYLIPSGYAIISVNFAKCPSSAILADCLAHPNSVTNG